MSFGIQSYAVDTVCYSLVLILMLSLCCRFCLLWGVKPSGLGFILKFRSCSTEPFKKPQILLVYFPSLLFSFFLCIASTISINSLLYKSHPINIHHDSKLYRTAREQKINKFIYFIVLSCVWNMCIYNTYAYICSFAHHNRALLYNLGKQNKLLCLGT